MRHQREMPLRRTASLPRHLHKAALTAQWTMPSAMSYCYVTRARVTVARLGPGVFAHLHCAAFAAATSIRKETLLGPLVTQPNKPFCTDDRRGANLTLVRTHSPSLTNGQWPLGLLDRANQCKIRLVGSLSHVYKHRLAFGSSFGVQTSFLASYLSV